MYLRIILSLLMAFCIVGCPSKSAKPLSKEKILITKHLVAMKKIKTAICNEIKQNSEIHDLTKIVDLINKRNNDKNGLLSNKIEGGQYYINQDIKIWKDFILKNKNENIIVIYCKTNLYPKSTGNKYFAGTLGTKYYPLKKPPFPLREHQASNEAVREHQVPVEGND